MQGWTLLLSFFKQSSCQRFASATAFIYFVFIFFRYWEDYPWIKNFIWRTTPCLEMAPKAHATTSRGLYVFIFIGKFLLFWLLTRIFALIFFSSHAICTLVEYIKTSCSFALNYLNVNYFEQNMFYVLFFKRFWAVFICPAWPWIL